MTETEFSCVREGLTIRGSFYRPEGGPLPIAVWSHGFSANREDPRAYARTTAELGYLSFIFDFCGGCAFGQSDGDSRDMSVLTEVKDLLAVAAFACALPFAKKDGMLLGGCSQGGFVSALAANRLAGAVSDLALIYPALCIPDDARRGSMLNARFDPANIPDGFPCGSLTLGARYVRDVIDMDAFSELTAFGGRTLIVHGTKDSCVNISYSERAERVLAAAGRDVRLVKIKGADHGFSGASLDQAQSAIRTFVREA